MLLLYVAVAYAAPSSADIELVNPTFEARSLPGVQGSWAGLAGDVRVGTLFQLTMDPLVYREGGEQVGVAIGERYTGQLGLAWNVTRRFSAHAFLPLVAQGGGDAEGGAAADLAASGPGAGDLGVGARVALLGGEDAGVSLRGDLRFPTGTPNAWLGEDGVRGSFGPGVSGAVGPLDLLGGVVIQGRTPVATPEDLTLGSELAGDAGLRLWLSARDAQRPLSVAVSAVGRLGLSAGMGEGELPAEAMLGAAWRPIVPLQLDLGVGHGLSPGYGTSRLRAFLGLTYIASRPVISEDVQPDVSGPPDRLTVQELVDADDMPAPVVLPPPPAEPQWERGELARVEQSQIIIREPIQFEKSTAEILSGSRPLLEAIAQRLVEHPEILSVIIEGHSSEEGDYAFNYELSVLRASAVFHALVDAGVDAQRLATRGLGEVVPVSGDAAANRRVVFHIVERRPPPRVVAPGGPPEPAPPKAPVTPVPWTGQKAGQVNAPGAFAPDAPVAPTPEPTTPETTAPGGEE